MAQPRFAVVEKGGWPLSTVGTFSLVVDMWDDYHYKTSFVLHYGAGDRAVEVGSVKVASRGMAEYDPHTVLPKSFERLEERFFSLGQDREYYEALMGLPGDAGRAALRALRDVAEDPRILEQVRDEDVFSTSLLRSVPLQTVTTQFRRIVEGKPALTPYRFSYLRDLQKSEAPPLSLEFDVLPEAVPPTNVHVLIGPNGVGKSRLLRDFVSAASGASGAAGVFRDDLIPHISGPPTVPFANVVHVAFSAFDRSEVSNLKPSRELVVHPVGLSEAGSEPLEKQFAESLLVCSKGFRRRRWIAAIKTLSSADGILAEARLESLLSANADGIYDAQARATFASMSSGHKIVLLTMTRLVELVEERSLILLDEPEIHLHPPLLSALTRAVSDLVIDRNGVAIVATHSPVVLQEVPRTCVWALRRSGEDVRVSRVATETFGESVSRLTSEVFHLDANRTGYHAVLRELLERYEGAAELVLAEINGQLGAEGRLVLSALERWADQGNV